MSSISCVRNNIALSCNALSTRIKMNTAVSIERYGDLAGDLAGGIAGRLAVHHHASTSAAAGLLSLAILTLGRMLTASGPRRSS